MKRTGSRPFRTVALFAGAGGVECGLAEAGFAPVLMADSDPAAKFVLRSRFPGVRIMGDVGEITELPAAELVAAGFPCQDLSMAGSKTGLLGRKSSAVDWLFDLLKRHPISSVLIENVYFMLHLNRGSAMQTVVRRLEGLGYSWAYRVVDSRSFGLPQRRRRVFLLAQTEADPGHVLFADEAGSMKEPVPSADKPIGFYWTEGASGHGLTADGIPPLKTGSAIGIPSPPAVLLPNGRVVRPTIETAELLQGFPIDWTRAAADCGMPRLRWRLVGNAVSPPAAAWIGQRLRTPANPVGCTKELREDEAWPMAAFGQKGRRWARLISDRPRSLRARSLLEYDPGGWEDISYRALAGFIRRARGSRLRYPVGFLERLERAAGHLDDAPHRAIVSHEF
jgi:DNA (cytosine-5)-methyltransferase 1